MFIQTPPCRSRVSFFCSLFAACALLFLVLPPLHAQNSDLPANLAGGLRELVEWHRAQPAAATREEGSQRLRQHAVKAFGNRLQLDNEDRVVVDVYLDGAKPAADVRAALTALGARVFAEHLPAPGTSRGVAPNGLFSAYLPVDRTVDAAQLPGVQSITLVRRPMHRVGLVTSQGAAVVKADVVNTLGFTGNGIRVGAISDSYDTAFGFGSGLDASSDVASDDLPGIGNPAGRTTPVFVLDDSLGGADEGRAMLQIIHDLAPDAALAFSTSGATEAAMASNIRALRTNANAPCDVIVDDVIFPAEPFFSDGVIAQAVDDVVTSNALGGKRVSYFSAAGNQGGVGYEADFVGVSDNDVRVNGLGVGNLDLSDVPPNLTSGGFHNFAAANGQDGVSVVQNIQVTSTVNTTESPLLVFQWPDPFGNAAGITTDYNVLVFNANGEYLGNRTKFPGNSASTGVTVSTTDSFATGLPYEIFELPLGADPLEPAIYQIAITRRVKDGVAPADHFRYVIFSPFLGLNVTGDFIRNDVPTTYGHPAAANSIGVAAKPYFDPATPEDFTSLGPVTIYFDAAGNRLATPIVRLEPSVAAPDGVDTTFFGEDTDSDGFPNFFGTSAAAPHAAAVAALLLQAGGGPGKVTPERVRTLLQNSPAPRDIDPFFSSANLGFSDGSRISLTAQGDNSDLSGSSTNFFTLSYPSGPVGGYVTSVTIDLAAAGLMFNTNANTGEPFTVGDAVGISAGKVGATVQTPKLARGQRVTAALTNSELVLKFPANAFTVGDSLSFGIGRINAMSGDSANSADLLQGAPVTVTLTPAVVRRGASKKPITSSTVLSNTVGTGYSRVDGFGLINAQTAVQALLSGQ
ncbi:MAG: S8 family serine peptidase [Verrucomicrobia bacterium]|nr:S8 family serine peptidase [Verrucomicrobiota bacterium]